MFQICELWICITRNLNYSPTLPLSRFWYLVFGIPLSEDILYRKNQLTNLQLHLTLHMFWGHNKQSYHLDFVVVLFCKIRYLSDLPRHQIIDLQNSSWLFVK